MARAQDLAVIAAMPALAALASLASVATPAPPASVAPPAPPASVAPPAPPASVAPVPAAEVDSVLVSAVFYDGYAPRDADEAVQLWNVGESGVDLSRWTVTDGEGTAAFPSGAALAAGDYLWLAREAEAFATSFGFEPDWAWSRADAAAPLLATTGGGPALANGGDEVLLLSPDRRVVDALAYGVDAADDAWSGRGVGPYAAGVIGSAHQVLSRKLAPDTGRPVPDTGTAADWASDPDDAALGRRARFPGWEVERRYAPSTASGSGTLEVAVAPDALVRFLTRHLTSARTSVDMAVYTFDHPDLAELLADRARSGVRVRLLVDGSPVGGIDLGERWCLALIAEAGGEVYWHDAGGDVQARFRSAHAKLAVVDDRWVLIGSENPSLGAAPVDDPTDGTAGRRGVYVATDVRPVVDWAAELLAGDLDSDRHVDARPFQPRDPRRGAPPVDFTPARESGGSYYQPVFDEPLRATGRFTFTMVTAPENALHPSLGPLGLVARAGAGDQVLVEQLREPLWWGDGPDEGGVALNQRVQAYVDAARRGAQVRVLVDSYFDDREHWNSNAAMVNALNAVARFEDLDLEARLGNPAGLGLHNKMVLVGIGAATGADGVERIDQAPAAAGIVHVGSLNGSEVSSKVNREVALQVESAAVHAYLSAVFAADWSAGNRFALRLPFVQR
ncbi:MAG: phospholipase D-like domain-containing protein [Anaerolineae bacterium]